MIAIIDYEIGNLRSVQKAIERVGGAARLVNTPEELEGAEKIILPGVAAFGDAMAELGGKGFVEPIRRWIADGRPYLGFCLGLQLLFEVSHEEGEHRGLGVLSGEVVRFDFSGLSADPPLRVPHMGWNQLRKNGDCPLLRGVGDGEHVYFAHSFHVSPGDPGIVAAETDYGYPFVSAVWRENLFATQFHPEKSQSVGMRILENFVRW